jgi:hypothetical protein
VNLFPVGTVAMMNRIFKSLFSIAALVGMLALNAGCSGQQQAQARVTDSPSLGDGGGTGGGNNPTLPTTLEDTFKIYTNFSNANVASYLHDTTSTDWSKTCSVSPNATSSSLKYIDCIMEVHELDLFFSSLTLGFNIPANMCEYVQVRPYWHWRGTAGVGPTAVLITVNGSAPPTLTSYTASSISPALSASIKDAQVTCSADHSKDPNGKNCCEGSYTLTVRTNTPASGGNPATSSDSVSTVSWGGKVGNCAAGAMEDWSSERDVTHNIPGFWIYPAKDGYTGAKSAVKIKAPIDTIHEDVVYTANYFDPLLYTPPSMTDSVYVTATSFFKPRLYYEYTCLDEAWDAKARIRLQIRRWTTTEQLAIKGDWNKAGVETNPTNGSILDKDSWETGSFATDLLSW